MEKLNKLIWPLILLKAKEEINYLFHKGHDIIVLEAAVLIQAKWQNVCSEIWTCIIPQNEVSPLCFIHESYFIYVYVVIGIYLSDILFLILPIMFRYVESIYTCLYNLNIFINAC